MADMESGCAPQPEAQPEVKLRPTNAASFPSGKKLAKLLKPGCKVEIRPTRWCAVELHASLSPFVTGRRAAGMMTFTGWPQ